MDPRTEKMLAERRKAAESVPPPTRAGVIRQAAATWLKAHWFLAVATVTLLITAFSVTYYTLVSLPKMKREQIALAIQTEQRQQAETAAKQAGLEVCMSNAQADYTALWDGACKERNAATGCALPTPVVEAHERRRREARADCLRQYSLDPR